ncbi:Methylamine utilization protein MauE [Corynebacterium capitovis DSM 44611]|uniref:MauE/DoxX family redox-associated membrane protein n=1 Tax=Corynebacterium capitovis TaxID=131081 RepID=UPI000367AEB3|nr:MauE/DoxX family redox-associated membrane protein [Corynebacterium capitovis]WKD57099.1 Methylamine utilization protein MauE [Corynebacterium capitovis DSM 44611]
MDILSAAARFFMAYIWISAGVSKIGVHMDVTQTIRAYDIFTADWSDMLATIIGPLEIAGGLLLLLGVKLRPAGWLSIVILSLFIIGLASAWSRGIVLDCGCFTPDQSEEGTNLLVTIARDIGFIAITLFMIYRPYTRWAVYP